MEQKKSEREELKEKLEADFNIDNLKKVLEYCKSNIDSMDKDDETDKDLLDYSAGYLMQYKLGSLDKGEAAFLAKYYAMYCIGLYEKNGLLMQDVKMEVLNQEEYEKKLGDGSLATCTDEKDGTQTFSYSEKLIEMVMSNKSMDVLMAFQAIGHEVVHGVQNSMIRNGEVDGIDISNIELAYLMALEKLTRKGFPEFYDENYDNLIIENNAQANGLRLATGFLKAWAPQAFGTIDEEKVQEVFDKYRENAENSERIVSGKTIKKENVHMVMENAARVMLRKNPKLLQNYPILKVAYNEDGTRKSATSLLDERETRIEKDENIVEKANDLFLTILDSRYMTKDGINGQIDEIESYTWHRESDFGFACDILRNRFEKLGLSKAEIEERIGGLEVVEHEDEKSQSKEQQESSGSKQGEQIKGVEQEASGVNPDEAFKREFDAHMKAVAEAKARGDKEALKELSDEMYRLSGHGNYLAKATRINPYFKDYMDKREFDEHMKAVAEAKARGDKVALRELANDMREYSGYATHLSETPHRINSYFKAYMDNRQNEQNKGQVQKHRTQEKSFRDEVGDGENTVKEVKEQAQTSPEEQWMETMKGFSDRVTEIEGYSKKQGEMVQAVSMAERQQEEQRTGQNLEDTEK